jgi:diacylglycerol kinase family enzyme
MRAIVAQRSGARKGLDRGRAARQHALVQQRVLILANPIAGGGRSKRLAPQLADALRARGVKAEVYFTQRAGDAGARARAPAGEGVDALIAVGGDGTLNEVLNGMPDPSVPLGVLPVGTANVLACELRIPKDPVRLAELIASRHTREHAIGVANGRRFLLFCGAGLDAAIVEEVARTRTGTLGKWKWLPSIFRIVVRWPLPRLRATFADGSSIDNLSSVLVTRVRNYGGVAQLPKGIDPASPQLFVLCFSARSRIVWAWLGLRAALGLLSPCRWLTMRAASEVHIEGTAPMQIDGDFAGSTSAKVKLHAARANLFAP